MEPAETYSLTHAKSEGVIVAAGPSVRPFEQPLLLIDLAPTILAALGAPSQVEHTGRVLHEPAGSDAKAGKA